MTKNLLAVVLAEKVINRKQAHMLVEAGGDIPIGTLFGIRIIPKSGDWVGLQVITNGINSSLSYSFSPRPKVVVQNQTKSTPNRVSGRKNVKFEQGQEKLL